MMPPHIVERLVAGEKTMSESHNAVSILFSDIVGWTSIAAALPTAGVVRLLDHVFRIFDGLTAQFGVFKVETIGDAYMVAAGHEVGDLVLLLLRLLLLGLRLQASKLAFT